MVPVSVSMLKQIAGRAGRRSSQWLQGLATCRNDGDVGRLREALAVSGGCGVGLRACELLVLGTRLQRAVASLLPCL